MAKGAMNAVKITALYLLTVGGGIAAANTFDVAERLQGREYEASDTLGADWTVDQFKKFGQFLIQQDEVIKALTGNETDAPSGVPTWMLATDLELLASVASFAVARHK